MQGETVLGSKEGTYTQSDYHGDSMVNLLLKNHVKLEVYTYIYTAKCLICTIIENLVISKVTCI